MTGNRLSVSALCFPSAELPEALTKVQEAGARSTTIQADRVREHGWKVGLAEIAASGVSITAMIERPFELADRSTWGDRTAGFLETVEAAAEIGAPAIYMITGQRLVGRSWAESADLFAEAIEPVQRHAVQCGVKLAIEPANSLYSDVTFVHTMDAALRVMDLSGLSVCVWTSSTCGQSQTFARA